MKKQLQWLVPSFFAISILLFSCKKAEKDPVNNPGNSNELATHSEDQARFSAETDDVTNDANDFIGSFPEFGRPGGTSVLPCNASTVLDSTATDRRLTVTYNGPNCFGNRSRTGVVVLTMPRTSHWGDAGAVLTITIQNLRITRLSDSKSIVLNGTSTVTNVSGGHVWQLATLGHDIIHDIASSGLTVTFDNGAQRVWQVSKRRAFSYNNGIVITTTGTHTANGSNTVAEWGTTRFGTQFYTSITQPLVIRQDCAFRLVAGQVTHTGLQATMVTTFGLDSSGNSVSTCPSGFYYFKSVWTGTNGAVVTVIYPY